jgi:hypothetical protein
LQPFFNVQNSGKPRVLLASIERSIFAKSMDCRVKPGNDGGNRAA